MCYPPNFLSRVLAWVAAASSGGSCSLSLSLSLPLSLSLSRSVCDGPDADVTSLVLQSTCALSPGLTGPEVQWNKSTYWGCQIKAKEEALSRRRLNYVMHKQLVVGKKSGKNVDQHSDWELHPGCSPSQIFLLLTMWQLERLGSGCSPPRLLLLVYTSLCALGGECFPFSVCCFDSRGAVPFVGGAEILLRERAALQSPLLVWFQSPEHPQPLLLVCATNKAVFTNTDWLLTHGKVAANYGTQHIDRCSGCRLRYWGLNVWPQEDTPGWTLSLLLPLAVCIFLCGCCFFNEGEDKLGHWAKKCEQIHKGTFESKLVLSCSKLSLINFKINRFYWIVCQYYSSTFFKI